MHGANESAASEMQGERVSGSSRMDSGNVTPVRTPSPVQFTNSSPSSTGSTPRHSRGAGAHTHHKSNKDNSESEAGAIPTFTVTSSILYTPASATAPTAGPMRALNPQAKEFSVPSPGSLFGSQPSACATSMGINGSMGNTSTGAAGPAVPLFAMPAQRTTSSPLSGVTAAGGSGRPDFAPWRGNTYSNPRRACGSPIPVDAGSAAAQLESLIRTRYTAQCEATRTHVVAVLNLDPRTSREALLQIFFPMGASSAEVLRPSDLPAALATVPLVSRRFVGVVFFPSKDLAMVGVEKRDQFVPNGQHHPLRVVYCGPDVTATPLSGSALPSSLSGAAGSNNMGAGAGLPWMLQEPELSRVHEEMKRRYATVCGPTGALVAIHALDASSAQASLRTALISRTGAMDCEPWPPQFDRTGSAWRCRSTSVVALYASVSQAQQAVAMLDALSQVGQLQSLRAVLLPMNTPSGFPVGDGAALAAHHPRRASSRDYTTGASAAAAAFDPRAPAAGTLPSTSLLASQTASMPTVSANVSLSGTTAVGRSDAPALTFAAAADPSRSFEEIHQHFLTTTTHTSAYLVAVHNLDLTTDKKRLYKIFYPIGAFDAELFPVQVILGGKPRRSGVALFVSKEMAEEAAAKIDDFVPHGQTRPLVTYLLSRDRTPATAGAATAETGRRNAAASTMPSPRPGTAAAATTTTTATTDDLGAAVRGLNLQTLPPTPTPTLTVGNGAAAPRKGSSTPRTTPGHAATVEQLLRSVKDQLAAASVNATVLAETMAQVANHVDANESTAKQLAELLSSTLVARRNLAIKLATPLSGALMALHEMLGIKTMTNLEDSMESATDEARSNNNGSTEEVDPRKLRVVTEIARAMLLLVAGDKAPPDARRVAGMLCSYFFQFSYLPSSPYLFAVRLIQKNEAALQRAKAYLGREAGIPTTADEVKANMPWITLIEALEEMTFLARRRSRRSRGSRSPSSADARAYEAYIHDFYDGNVPRTGAGVMLGMNGGRGSGSGCTSSSCDHLDPAASSTPLNASIGGGGVGATNSSKRQALVTPSARPTPRPVVTRLSSGANTSSAVRTAKVAAGPGGGTHTGGSGGVSAPHVVLTPASDGTQGVSADISLESNHAFANVAQSLRSLGPLPGFAGLPLGNLSGLGSAATVGGAHGSATTAPSVQTGAGNTNANTSTNSSGAGGAAATHTTTTAAGASTTTLSDHRADSSECTVYVTKLPSLFTSGQVHRLLSYFGEVNKVRLCRDEKENPLPVASPAGGDGAQSYHRLCFGFVEFAEPQSAKAMVEYFRNAIHTPLSFEFLRLPQQTPPPTAEAAATYFTEEDIQLLRGTRTSQARNRIHDRQPLDALLRPATPADGLGYASMTGAMVRERPCLFGLVQPQISIEAYGEVYQDDSIAAAATASLASAPAAAATGAQLWHYDPVATAAAAVATPAAVASTPTAAATNATNWEPNPPSAAFTPSGLRPPMTGYPSPLYEDDDGDVEDDYDPLLDAAVRTMQSNILDGPYSAAGVVRQASSETEGRGHSASKGEPDRFDDDDEEDQRALQTILAQVMP